MSFASQVYVTILNAGKALNAKLGCARRLIGLKTCLGVTLQCPDVGTRRNKKETLC